MIFESAYRQLQPSERAFVDDYVIALEHTAARTGTGLRLLLSGPVLDRSERAQSFLARPLVTAAISERVEQLCEATELSPRRIMKEVHSLAFSNVRDFMEVGQDGQPYFDLARCTREQFAAIASIEIEESPRGGRKFKFKLHDKIQPLVMMMRHAGMLEADNPYWQEEQKKTRPVQQTRAIPAGANDDDAAEAYSQLVNG